MKIQIQTKGCAMRANDPRRLRRGIAMTAVLAAGLLPAGLLPAAAGASEIQSARVCANPSGLLRLAGDGETCDSTETSMTFATGAGVAELRDRVDTLSSENLTLKHRVGELEEETSRMQASTDSLASRASRLEPVVEALDGALEGVSRHEIDGRDTLRFTGMNLQILNGEGSTYERPNGLGNIILGYNALPNSTSDLLELPDVQRSGSHYLVVGDGHSWGYAGGIVAGRQNWATGLGASVLGGVTNNAAASYSAILAGNRNRVEGAHAAIVSGVANVVGSSRPFGAILGGGGHALNDSTGSCSPSCGDG